MSAFVVDNATINRVISYLTGSGHTVQSLRDAFAREYMIDFNEPKEVAQLGEEMLKLNCRAVDARYGAGESQTFRDDMTYSFRREACMLIQAYKSLSCWRYQCSEGDVPDTSLLFSAMSKLHDQMAHAIVSSLKQYEAAKWE